jgi:hypothetical protein
VQETVTEADEEVNKIFEESLKPYYSQDLTRTKNLLTHTKGKFGIVQAF